MKKKKTEKTCGLTGNRNIIHYDNKKIELLNEKIDFVLKYLIKIRGVKSFLCGMPIGADLMIAKRIIKYREEHNADIKIYSVIPCEKQDLKWKEEQKREYKEVLKECEPSDYKYSPYTEGCMLKRNRYIVDNCSIIFVIFNENVKRGGTFQTINYATKKNKDIYILNPKTLEIEAISSKKKRKIKNS